MIKVDPNRINNYAAPKRNIKAPAATPNFTGNSSLGAKMIDNMAQKTWLKIMQKMKWFDGEEGRILLTAIGTGAIAPLFIAWNPYVKPKKDATLEEKEDLKKTQKYTAMRQPISAALQILIQLSILSPLNKGLDALFHNPENSKYLPVELDKSVLHDDKYLERKIAKEIKEEGLTLDKKEMKAEIARRVSARQKEQIGRIAAALEQSGQIHIGDRLINNEKTANIVNDVIDNYIKDAKNLQVGSQGMDYYLERAKILVNNKQEFNQILQNLPDNDAEIANYLKQKLNTASNDEVKGILNEIINLPETERRSKSIRTVERIRTIEDICGRKFSPKKYLASMREDYDVISDVIDRLKSCKIKNPAEATSETIQSTIQKIADVCRQDEGNMRLTRIFHDTEVFKTNVENLLKKVCTDIVSNYKGVMGKRYRAIKEITGISIGLFLTTPLTCTALNWVYPRFMDKFFPNLSGKNKKPTVENKAGGEK